MVGKYIEYTNDNKSKKYILLDFILTNILFIIIISISIWYIVARIENKNYINKQSCNETMYDNNNDILKNNNITYNFKINTLIYQLKNNSIIIADEDDIKKLTNNAIHEWTKYININIKEYNITNSQSDFIIYVDNKDINSDFIININTKKCCRNKQHIYSTILHGLGNILGLIDNHCKESVMYFLDDVDNRKLSEYDIKAIRDNFNKRYNN